MGLTETNRLSLSSTGKPRSFRDLLNSDVFAVITSPSATGTYVESSTGFTWTYYSMTGNTSLVVSVAGYAEVLLVAGGGGGGGAWSFNGSPGGAGGVIARPVWLIAKTFPITIGAGGSGGAVNVSAGGVGGNTSLGDLVAYGGGGGGVGLNGGSNGGSGGSGGGGATSQGTAVLSGLQGNSGNANGPGGAGGAATSGSGGGPPIASSITGTELNYAKGGSNATTSTVYGNGGIPTGGNGTVGGAGIAIVRVRI